MLDPAFHELRLPAGLEEAGHAYGRACAGLLGGPRLERYLRAMMSLKRTDPESLALHAAAWARRLPEHFRRQMQAMADGAGVAEGTVERFIARTDRDRGVLLFAADGRRGESAVFECSRASFRAVEPSMLADPGVKMRPGRGSDALRTIYSAVGAPARGRVWFASGACPAASAGTWREIRAAWD